MTDTVKMSCKLFNFFLKFVDGTRVIIWFMSILQVIPGSDITYGVDPPAPLVAEPKGKKKSKDKKQKK